MRSADIEALLVAALPSLLGVPVAVERPTTVPDLMVTVTATGGPEVTSHVLDRPSVGVEVTGHDRPETAALALRTRDTLLAMAGTVQNGHFVADVDADHPRWFPNEDGLPRYFFTARILVPITE